MHPAAANALLHPCRRPRRAARRVPLRAGARLTAMSGDDRVLRFGIFEAHLRSGELRKNGVRVRLQDQPFQVLAILLERPRELVSREELATAVWPGGTFVDFDHSLNTAVNKLREVLNDSAQAPRFIETLPRRGYRFLADVEVLRPAPAAQPGSVPEGAPRTTGEGLPVVPRALARVLFLLAQMMYLAFYVSALAGWKEVHSRLGSLSASAGSLLTGLVLLTALAGIPVRFFLLTAVAFDFAGFRGKYDRLFSTLLLLDLCWGLAPLLVAPPIGIGLALAAMAALLYLPFGQRTLVRMAYVP
jgi:cholera toxin transcriptional activator